jgi:hypothetical protein
MENINRDDHRLLFKGEEFRLAQLLGLSRTAPPIVVKIEDLNLLGIIKDANAVEEQPYVARHVPVLDEYQNGDLVFYKQEGKMTVLFGHEKARLAYNRGEKLLKGRFISSPLLKKTRIEKPIAAEQIVEKIEAAAPAQFNAPRFTQDRRVNHHTERQEAPRRGLSDAARRTNAGDPRNQNIKRGNYTGGLYKKS